jgi:hypothetical protein
VIVVRFPELPASAQVELLVDLGAEQQPAIVLVAGVVWEAHLESVLSGTVVAAARAVGLGGDWERMSWQLAEIEDLAAKPEEYEEPDDPLQVHARELAAQARRYAELPLAERILLEREQRR